MRIMSPVKKQRPIQHWGFNLRLFTAIMIFREYTINFKVLFPDGKEGLYRDNKDRLSENEPAVSVRYYQRQLYRTYSELLLSYSNTWKDRMMRLFPICSVLRFPSSLSRLLLPALLLFVLYIVSLVVVDSFYAMENPIQIVSPQPPDQRKQVG
jgi:hypothetical protein